MIDSNDILSYRVKGYFPNYQNLKHLILNNSLGGSKALPSYKFPVLEYQLVGQSLEMQDLAFEDIHILNALTKGKSLEYVAHLINYEKTEQSSVQYITKARKQFIKEQLNYFEINGLIENEYIVPSSTNNKYGIQEVSHKGSSLLELTQEGYPVPDFCILTSNSYNLSRSERNEYVLMAIENLEKLTGQKLGSIHSPLVFAMRCATSKYIPGLMPTYLNVGVTQDTFLALKEQYGYHVASKIYLYNLQTLYHLVYPNQNPPMFKDHISKHSFRDIYQKIQFYYEQIERIDSLLLSDAVYQIFFLVDEVHKFYRKNSDLLNSLFIKDKSYPSFILQKMVWTVRDKDSYPGVLYSAHSRSGIGKQIESYPEIFGEEIMTGAIEANDLSFESGEEISESFPAVHHFLPKLPDLEKKLESPVTIEFAAESFNNIHFFALLQLNASELTGRATLLSAINLYRDGIIGKERVLSLVHPYHKRQLFSESIDDNSLEQLNYFSSGVSVLPRLAVSCKVYFSAEKALAEKKKGNAVCLCKEQFVPSDTIVMSEVDAILSLNPAAIHVVTACLSYGVPAFLNLEEHHVVLKKNKLINSRKLCIKEGDWITISSKYQTIYLGKAKYIPARFERYLNGKQLELSKSDQYVFKLMAEAYREYQDILAGLTTSDITNLKDLIKVIRTDLKNEPVKASKFMNSWCDSNSVYYLSQVMSSALGMHKDHSTLYDLLSTDRKISFFKRAMEQCVVNKVSGYTAGAFMLGRFLSVPHPVEFWRAFYSTEVIHMLNEILLYEKYQLLLFEVGERNLNRAKQSILTNGLGTLNLSLGMIKNLVTLKLSKPDWNNLISFKIPNADSQLSELTAMLKRPYDHFFEFDKTWSLNKLVKICNEENLEIPAASDA